MTPVGEILRDEIAKSGPIRFHRFMEAALYHPELGYYCRDRDPFGQHGDYYTAEQIQPTFGVLIASYLDSLMREEGIREYSVVELGAGRSEMRDAFGGSSYVPVEVGDKLPGRITGAVFANEFFDALPVDVVRKRGGECVLERVGWHGDRFRWVRGETAGEKLVSYVERFAAEAPADALVEVNLDALHWVDQISAVLERGVVLVIDYGYRSRELVRFPEGTLMSYHRHRALEDVLADPGERDITAHVNFSALEQRAGQCGLESVRFETLGRMTLRAGEQDEFASVFGDSQGAERERRTRQLKSLTFGMGDTFLTLALHRGGQAQ